MPKSPNQKLKLLYLMEILLQQTDERHPMNRTGDDLGACQTRRCGGAQEHL